MTHRMLGSNKMVEGEETPDKVNLESELAQNVGKTQNTKHQKKSPRESYRAQQARE